MEKVIFYSATFFDSILASQKIERIFGNYSFFMKFSCTITMNASDFTFK
ncbi:unknown protein [Simkania negevensis Z]|uniref:Uncharacterized protein n=1 Tax=Simkania negevensis (strain ATCC VR-1471 / DSM 27360 / Z) TaxID=331113 RepID=F8L7X3_SIMNZ|nr:unknown protein [Simkania negevensis Z]